MESLYAAEITVLGIGNTILSDEGFGVRVVEYLKENYDFPENVAGAQVKNTNIIQLKNKVVQVARDYIAESDKETIK